MIATYKVNTRNGRQVKMEGDPDDLDKILHQMKTWQQMLEALRLFVDDTPCRYDHHGYCQEHSGGFAHNCSNAIAIAALKAAKDE
jgi:hypothetical protein